MSDKNKNIGVIKLSSTLPIVKRNDYVYKSLCCLIESSRNSQRIARENEFKEYWLEEFSTIRIKSSRGSGQTEAILKYLADNEIDSVVLSMSVTMSLEKKRRFVERLSSKGSSFINNTNSIFRTNCLNYFYSIHSDISMSTRGIQFPSIVFIDDSSWATQVDIDKIKKWIKGNMICSRDFFLVFIG